MKLNLTFVNFAQSSVIHLIRTVEHDHKFPQSFAHIFGRL